MHVDRRLLGWGVFFILLGGIPLANRAGLLDDTLLRQWPLLWPLLLIGWGLGLLLRGTPLALVGGAVTAITFGMMGGGALATGFGGISFASGCTGATPATAFPSSQGELGATARADIEFNCGKLAVTTADGTAWSVSGSDHDGTGPTVVANAGSLSLESETRNIFASGGRAEWSVTLPRSPVLALGLTLNAGEGTVRLDGASVATVSMTVNAGSMNLDLAQAAEAGDVNATVNLGDATIALPAGASAVTLSLNAGSLELCLPAGAPVRVSWSGNVGSNNLDDVGLIRGDGQTWTSAGFAADQPHIELHGSANAGSFELTLGGTCGA